MNLFKKLIILFILLVFFVDLLDSKKKKKNTSKKKDGKKNIGNETSPLTKNDKKKKEKTTIIIKKKPGRGRDHHRGHDHSHEHVHIDIQIHDHGHGHKPDKPNKKPASKPDKKPSTGPGKKPCKPGKPSGPGIPVKPGEPEIKTTTKPEIKPNITKVTFPVYYCVYLKPGEIYHPLRGVNRTILKEAISQLSERMCLQFVQLVDCRNESSFPHPLILFIDDLGTYINQYNFTYPIKFTNPYEIKIQASCNRKVGCFLKKILAYLGSYLTHRRKDRDSYITVNTSNVLDGYENEFDKIESDVYYNASEYDFGSVMHVSKFYRKNYLRGDPFKTQISSSYESMVGQEYGLSFSDYKILNYRYCRQECLNKLSCKNGGFQSSEGCEYCECPNGYKGNLCEDIEDSTGECGETLLNATSKSEILSIKGRGTCNILIKANDHKKINVTVIKASLGAAYPCFEKKGLEIKHRRDKSVTGLCLCTYAEKVVLESEDNTVFIQYNGFIQNHYANITYQGIN